MWIRVSAGAVSSALPLLGGLKVGFHLSFSWTIPVSSALPLLGGLKENFEQSVSAIAVCFFNPPVSGRVESWHDKRRILEKISVSIALLDGWRSGNEKVFREGLKEAEVCKLSQKESFC